MKGECLYYNGMIYTADSRENFVNALAVKDGMILYAGNENSARNYLGSKARTIDLKGKTALPGFIDSHLHAPGRILSDLYNISLYEAEDRDAILAIVGKFIKEHPDLPVYYGEGFSLGHFNGEEVSRGPRKEQLDMICPHKPVVIYSSDCHLAWLNSCALQTFGINSQTAVPAGGVIEIDPCSGALWGTLKEAAMRLIPEQQFTQSQQAAALGRFQNYLHSLGYTGILSISIASMPPLQQFHDLDLQGGLKMHVASSVTIDPEVDPVESGKRLIELGRRYDSENHKLRTAKFFTDGVVEGATAYLLEPYSAAAGKGLSYRGEFLWEEDKLASAFKEMNRAGFQVHVHSIGDASTRLVLDALEKAQSEQEGKDHRNTITHLQLVAPDDLQRFKRLGVIASVQPFWHFKEPGWWKTVDYHMLGTRAEYEYPLQSFVRAGVMIASSSDHPVTPHPNPLRAIRAGVTRNLTAEDTYGLPPLADAEDPQYLLNGQERVSLKTMIHSLTINGAFTIFRDHLTGSLEAGKQADLVVLDHNLFETDPLKLENIRVSSTYFKGEKVYGAENE